MSQNGNQMVDDVLRYFLFGLQRIILATFAINNANLVCIVTEAGSRIIQRVEDDKVKVFTFELSFGILLFVICFEVNEPQDLFFL